MKRILLATAIVLAVTAPATAQSVTTAIEQLAALRSLDQTLQQGYQTITTGLNTIGSIRLEEFGLHKTYITGLAIVQAPVSTDQRLLALRTRLARLTRQLQSSIEYWQQQPVLHY